MPGPESSPIAAILRCGNEEEKTMTTRTQRVGSKPTYRLFNVTGEGDTAYWHPIGAAWPNKDGKGFSVSCDAFPLSGRIVMRVITPRENPDQGRLV